MILSNAVASLVRSSVSERAKRNSVHYHMLMYVRIGALSDSAFNQPVLLFSPNPDGTVRRIELATVQDGFRALHRGLEGFCLDHPEWHLAFHSLSRAMLDPAPKHIEAARVLRRDMRMA